MKAPMTRDRYQTRVAKFFDFAGISGWIQASNQRLAQLEEFGRKCKDKNAWRSRVQKWLQPDPDAIPEIFDEELYYFFRDEGTKEPKDRLSSATKQGLF